MPLVKTQAEGINLADTFAFTGTVSGAGGILQIKQGTSTTQYDTSSTSISSSALNVSITPSSTSNRILIWYSFAGHCNASSDFVISTIYKNPTGGTGGGQVLTGGTDLSSTNYKLSQTYNQSGGGIVAQHSAHIIDSPSSTSAQTYYIGFAKAGSGSGSAYFNINSATAVLTVMEILPA